ncbi:MAG TPA: acetyl/propionyl/methylcrotonyl-CoA carboxylase subunit alpha [Steroidobacteraceae bacterium]|nr:acetyl/propionyl/methylcrotonyl-CoA carboxylase subunit alpha [Steroidobacteraceae bacterium]
MFRSLLVANRGEIACRVLRTAHRLGLRTVAVYSDVDERALHVELADEAVRIGPAPARESYLNIAAIVEAARCSGAEAIHPGYGFLSENADFAQACAQAGIVFIGPPVTAIRAMGSKIAAKRLMESAGVPLVPGYHGDDQDVAKLEAHAAGIGYPLLIKASAGGGGKGMRIVRAAGEFRAALEGAQREALKAFADDRVLLERYLRRPRHVEIQVFADRHGQCLHLHERDCSIQRRHQKIIEEAPAPGLPAPMRERMGAAAVTAARAVGYQGAGTVEFIVGDGEFYFMEMNTRLQVEHPVTEMITGLDLVEWQIRVAAGDPLPLSQADIRIDGHALEARIYAEDPGREFLPSTGTITHLRWPDSDPAIRVDAGIRQGDAVTVHYDPLLAKLIVHGRDRETAARRLEHALRHCEIVGLTTNLSLLRAVSAHPQFQAADLHTGFIEKHHARLFASGGPEADIPLLGLAALGWVLARTGEGAATASASGPWDAHDGWRLNGPSQIECQLRWHGAPLTIALARTGQGWSAQVGSVPVAIAAHFIAADRLAARIEGEACEVRWLDLGRELCVIHDGHVVTVQWDDPSAGATRETHAGGLASPMPGHVLQVLVRPDERVQRGQPLMIIEAMKMEHTITAPADGVVRAVHFASGDRVEEGAELLELAADTGR